MLTLHTWSTPNGRKASIMLEEVGLPYTVVPVNIGNNEQFAPAFLQLSPNNKIPALVDDEVQGYGGRPLALFESGAILVYLADKSGQLLAKTGPARYTTLEWVYWSIGGLGPMMGQLGYFAKRAPQAEPLAIQRFTEEADRLLGVLDRRLALTGAYVAGADYTIADIACYTWSLAAATHLQTVLADSLAPKLDVQRWLKAVGERPAVQRGMQVPPDADAATKK